MAVLQARAEGDIGKAVAIRRAARLLEQHVETSESSDPITQLSLNDFHANATSEDNAEFDEVQREELKEQRELFALMYDSKMAIPGDQSVKIETPLHLQLASDQFDFHENENVRFLKDTRNERPRNALFFTPQLPSSCSNGVDLGTVPKLLRSANQDCNETQHQIVKYHHHSSKIPKSFSSKECSNSMPPPRPVDMEQRIRERLIQPENTRFPVQVHSRIVVKTASAQKPSFLSSDTDTDLDTSPKPIDEVRKRSQIKKVAEYQMFVDMTPLIRPGDEEDNDGGSPIITWGTIASTPLVIASDRDAKNNMGKNMSQSLLSFEIKQEGKRDLLARAAEKQAVKRSQMIEKDSFSRLRGNVSVSSSRKKIKPSFKPTSLLQDRSKSLTPAARSLLAKSLEKKEGSYLRGSLSSVLSSSISRSSSNTIDSRLLSARCSSLRNSSSKRNNNRLYSSASTPQIVNEHRKKSYCESESEKIRISSFKAPVTKSSLTDGLLN